MCASTVVANVFQNPRDCELIIVHLVDDVVAHGSVWLPPASESNAILLGASSEIDNNARKNQPHEEYYDLQTARPKLQFCKKLYTKQVHNNNWRCQ